MYFWLLSFLFIVLVWGPLVIQLKYCPVLPSLNKVDYLLFILLPIQGTCGRVLMTMRDWFQEKQVLELDGMLTSKLLKLQ